MRLWFKATCSDCGQELLLPFKPHSKAYCKECRYKHPPYIGLEKYRDDSKSYESVRWGENVAILDGALGNPNSQANKIDTHQYHYERSKNKHYSEAYLAGLIGEIEGRKWLQENGYQVYEFAMMFHGYFGGLDNNISEIIRTYKTMRHRRKPEYAEADKQLIVDLKQGIIALVRFLKGKFGQDYIAVRRSFIAIGQVTKQNKVGERYPDFIVTKQEHCSLVEVKANKSKFYAGQVECFELVESYGMVAKVLKVAVQANKVKDIQLSDYKRRLSHFGVNYR